jgi:hypothetical protein
MSKYNPSPVKKFNMQVAGIPFEEAVFNLAQLETNLRQEGNLKAIDKINSRLKLVRNLDAEKIADGKEQVIILPEIIKQTTPKKIIEDSQKIAWRKQKLEAILEDNLLTMEQKERLMHEGVRYFPDGTVDLSPLAYRDVVIQAKDNKFSLNNGELDRKTDNEFAKKILKRRRIEKPEYSHFHHQVHKGRSQLVLVSQNMHQAICHLGYLRYYKQ